MHTSTKSTVLESFPLYGSHKTSIVCTSHDLLKSQVVVLHAQDHLDLMLQLDAAVPTCAWQQIDDSHHGGGVLNKFGIRDYVVNKACSHDTKAGKCSFAFVGIGNCIGNVWPVNVDEGLYPCTLHLQFIEAVPRGSAILMGSLHSVRSLDDDGGMPYLTVAPSFGKGAANLLRDVPPGLRVGKRKLTSLEVLQKQQHDGGDNDDDKAIGDRFAGDFVTANTDGEQFATEEHDSKCVVCSANELLPHEAHVKASGRKLELVQVEREEEEEEKEGAETDTFLCAVNGYDWLFAGQQFEVDSYGAFRRDEVRQSYRWVKTRNAEDRYLHETYTPWYNNNDGKWYAHRVRSLDALPDEECQELDPCRINDGEGVVARFKNGSSYVVENHIEDLGSCLKSWVVEHSQPAMTADEERLDACLAKAVAEFFLTEQPSPPPSPPPSSVTFSMSPVSMSWNTLMMGSTSPEFSFASDDKPDNLTAAAAVAVPPPPPSSSLISDLKALKLMLHTFDCCDM